MPVLTPASTPASTPAAKPRRPMRPLSLAALGALILPALLAGCDSLGTPRFSEIRAMQIPHIAGSAVGVENANGSVEILARDRQDVSLEVKIYGTDAERVQFATLHADRMGDQTLRVWVEWPGGKRRSNEGAAISINVPDAKNVNVRTSNGRIVIEGLSGHASLISSNGSIRADTHDGSLYAKTSNGSVQGEHISGEVEMYSSNGKIVITDAYGPIRAETSNASTYVSTMPGNRGPVRVRSSNGRIDLDLGEGFEGVLKCDTSNGKVQISDLGGASLIESSGNHAQLRVGASSEISAARTSNGSIRVRGR